MASANDNHHHGPEDPWVELEPFSPEQPRFNPGLADQEGDERRRDDEKQLLYGVEESPPLHLTVLFGLQNVLMSISGCINVPLVISGLICAGNMPIVKAKLVGTFLTMCGISTILQCLIGVRLPIMQGASSTFIPPIMAMMSLDQWACRTQTGNGTMSYNGGNSTWSVQSVVEWEDEDEIWQRPLRELQGAIMLASLTQCCIGGFGLIGPILRFVGPLTVTPCVGLIGLALTHICIDLCEKQWGVAIMSIALLFLFSMYLSNIKIPLPVCNVRKKTRKIIKFPLFKLLPVLLTIFISWSVCLILQACGVLGEGADSPGGGARTDVQTIEEALWIYIPYPGQWGRPTVSVASYVGILCATFASVVESIGDYYACARACQISPPPPQAINRGIMIEGFGSVIAGALGTGGASTSYSNNIGAISITSVASRRAFVCCGILLVIAGLFGKFGGLLASMPEPIIGATLVVGLGVVVSVALANLSYVDMNSARNQTILGFSFMMGLIVPQYVIKSPIKTGIIELDQALGVMLGTPMFVGGALGCFLDNTIPGSDEERGIAVWKKRESVSSNALAPDSRTYKLPYVNRLVKRWPFLEKIPFL